MLMLRQRLPGTTSFYIKLEIVLTFVFLIRNEFANIFTLEKFYFHGL